MLRCGVHGPTSTQLGSGASLNRAHAVLGAFRLFPVGRPPEVLVGVEVPILVMNNKNTGAFSGNGSVILPPTNPQGCFRGNNGLVEALQAVIHRTCQTAGCLVEGSVG